MVLQTLVEGMVLEAHISSENVTNPSPVHLVELYSQYGSQVSGVLVLVWVGVGCEVVLRFHLSLLFCRRPYLSTESWWTRGSLCGRRTHFNRVIVLHCLLIF